MISLIDGDLIAYRCAASCEKQGVVTENLDVALHRATELLSRIITTTSAQYDHEIYLSGSSNFRKQINPAYKANRTDQKRPEYLEPLRAWLVESWGAKLADNCEADDMLGIDLTKYGEDAILCTLDKDLRQVPGNHYSWEISGTSSLGKVWVRPEERLYISPREGLLNFYWQMVMGDPSDNVFGFDGKARGVMPKKLEGLRHEMEAMTTEQELFDYVRDLYNEDSRFLMNGACLWIQRKEDDNWLSHGHNLMGASGPKQDSTALLPLPSEQELDDGNQSIPL